MTPVMLLSDGYVANSAEPWQIPNVDTMPPIEVKHPSEPLSGPFMPYQRNKELARPWAIPGTPGYEHRTGGMEKEDMVGCVSHDPANHETMVQLRQAKIAGIKPPGAPFLWTGNRSGDVLIIGWGGTHGAIKAATLELKKEGLGVSACHLRYLNPLPEDLLERMNRFSEIIVAELNLGQLAWLLRAKYLVNATSLTKVRGQPFTIQEIMRGVKKILAQRYGPAPAASTTACAPAANPWVRDEMKRPECGTFNHDVDE
jgi:2-oxoglutarate ferredoxin oxidoreductase subunit alpha